MGNYYNEAERKLREGIEALKRRRTAIEIDLTGNSPVELFRELSTINHKLIVAQSHVNGTFGRGTSTGEYYTREIN